MTDIHKGDLVACYVLNSSLEQEAQAGYEGVLESPQEETQGEDFEL